VGYEVISSVFYEAQRLKNVSRNTLFQESVISDE